MRVLSATSTRISAVPVLLWRSMNSSENSYFDPEGSICMGSGRVTQARASSRVRVRGGNDLFEGRRVKLKQLTQYYSKSRIYCQHCTLGNGSMQEEIARTCNTCVNQAQFGNERCTFGLSSRANLEGRPSVIKARTSLSAGAVPGPYDGRH